MTTTQPLDLAARFGPGRLETFPITHFCRLPSTVMGDEIVVDRDAVPTQGPWLAVEVGRQVEVGTLAASGDRVWLHERMLPIGGNVRVLGVVVGLSRRYERR